MADKLLKSIKFPTLPDRYVIGDSTLTEEGAAADAKATGDEITNVKSDISYIEQSVGVIAQIKLNFEQGTFNNSTGEETSDGYRIRTDDYISLNDVKSITISPVTGYKCNIFVYDSSKTFKARSQTTTPFVADSSRGAYMRFAIQRDSSEYAFPSLANPYTNYVAVNVSYYGNTKYVTKNEIKDFVGIGDTSELLLAFEPSNGFSDLTVIGNKLYCFKASDMGVSIGSIFEYELDFENKTATRTKVFYHHWGHCNTVDYCEETDALFLAYEYNGDTEEEYVSGKFYIIPNISSIFNSSNNYETLPELSSCAIEYDCNSLDYGRLLNGCWGYNNYGANDLVIINTNRCKNFRILQLGKGTNNLGLGSYSASAEGIFNGSFKLIKEFVLDIDPPSGYVNQGADFYNGVLYLAMGHLHDLYWIVELKADGTAHVMNERYMPITNESGTLQSGSTEGVCVTTTLMIANISTPLGARVEVRRR